GPGGGGAGLVEGLGQAERGGDGEQDGPLDGAERLGAAEASGGDHQAAGEQGGDGGVGQPGGDRDDERPGQDRRDPGVSVAGGGGPLDLGDEVEVVVVAEGPAEVGADLQQQR